MDSVGAANFYTALSQANVLTTVGVLVAKKELDVLKTVASSTIQLIDDASDIGKNLNIKL